MSIAGLSPTPARADTHPQSSTPPKATCYPAVDPGQTQYIIGYGSLMEDASRSRTSPDVGSAYPVAVKGYRRGWFGKGTNIGFNTTYLGVVADQKANLNGVIYQVKKIDEITATDKREDFYCRVLVTDSEMSMLSNTAPKPTGQVWIYVNRPESVALANAGAPIAQSYVDIFISGCLEQQEQFNLPDFAKQCIETTSNWSNFWVNDRIYPRRPFIYQPRAIQIDKLLRNQLPQYFEQIRIEGGSPTDFRR